jgi:hypothetical protein
MSLGILGTVSWLAAAQWIALQTQESMIVFSEAATK